MKLEIGECACSKRGTVYCRMKDGSYKFVGKKCSNIGHKVTRK